MKIKAHQYWLFQRLSAVFLILCLPILGLGCFLLKNANYQQTKMMVASPFSLIFLGLTLTFCLVHAFLGMQVIIRDYLKETAALVGFVILCGLVASLFMLMTFSLLRIVLI